MSARVLTQSISEQVNAISAGVLTAEDLATHTREEIERSEPHLRAWVELAADITAQSRRVDQLTAPLPLRGVSVGVKDLIDVAGLPTRAGSPLTSEEAAETDADCVTRLRTLGTVVQGKTVTTEYGYFSPGPTRNPHANGHTPGGSSSGSAAAAGAGIIPLALGTQTAGSLTRPASFCGAAGMVLAHGSTSMAGITGLSESLDSLGLLTRSVEDLRTVYRAFSQADIPASSPRGTTTVLAWHGSGLDEVSPSMRGLLQRLPLLINKLGVECQPLDWHDHVLTLASDHVTVMAHEAARTRSDELARHGEAVSAPLRQLLEQGSRIPTDDRDAALARRDRSRVLLAEVVGSGSLVIGPAALGPAPAGLATTGSPILSRPWQLLGLPVVVVPGAMTTTGLPLGLQVIGLPGREQDMLNLGVGLEQLLRNLAPLEDGTS